MAKTARCLASLSLLVGVGVIAFLGWRVLFESGDGESGDVAVDPPNATDPQAEAIRTARANLSVAEREHDPDSVATAEVLDELVEVLYEGGQATRPETRDLASRSLAIKQKLLAGDDPALASSLDNLAAVLNSLGEYEQAIDYLDRSLKIKIARSGAVSQAEGAIAIARLNLGELCRQTGSFREARAYFEAALSVLEGHPKYARSHACAMTHNNYGLLLHNTGDYLEAEAHLRAARAFWEQDERRTHDLANVLNNLGRLLHDQGDYRAARDEFEKARDLWKRVVMPNLPRKAMVLNNLGYLYHDAGEPDAAEPLYAAALALREDVLGKNHRAVAWTLSNLGLLRFEQGRLEEALPLFERALEIRASSLGDEHKLVFHSLTYLASLRLSLGQLDQALESAMRAEGVRRRGLLLALPGLPERQALEMVHLYLSVFGLEATSLDLALSALSASTASPARQQDVTAVWDAVIRARGLVFDEMANRRRFHLRAGDVESRELFEEVTLARQQLANRWVQGLDLEKARVRKERAEAALAQKSLSVRAPGSQPVGWREVVEGLEHHPPGSAIVAFVQYRRMTSKASKKPRPIPSYAAFLFARGWTEPRFFPLGSTRKADALIERWRQGLVLTRAGEHGAARQAIEAGQRSGIELRQMVWDPLIDALGEAAETTRVYVVPAGALHLIHFAGLPAGDDVRPDMEYVVENGPILHHLSSEKDVYFLGVESREEPVSSAGLLALGRPEFLEPSAGRESGEDALKNGSDCLQLRKARFEDLPATEVEVRAVESLFRAADATAEIHLLTGADASETAFRELAPGRRVLHLATHGFYLDDACLDGEVRNAGGGPLIGSRRIGRAGASPLLLSGLALAGANTNHGDGGADLDDGILTAEEIATLDLSGVEWAVLSACSTGVGEIRRGEGVFGLRRAFQHAGAGSLITSLWPVEDRATQEWMEALYRARFERRLSTAEAVREASLAVLRARRSRGESTHPFYWAGFVGSGDWR